MTLAEFSPVEVIGVLVFWLIVARWWYRQRTVQLPRVTPVVPHHLEPPPLVSVIVPARNEARQIETCVRSLLAQDYLQVELIVVDDCSEDNTGEILARLAATDPRLTVVRGTPLPEGWMGKTHAIAQGYRIAQGDWLLFTDADTTHAPGLLAGVMALLLASPASCATVMGQQHAPSSGAALVNLAVFTGIFMMTDPRRYTNPKSRVSTLNGQYILFARKAYEAIGTHVAIRHYASDDAALGYVAKLHGYVPLLLEGGDMLQTTMYHTLAEAWRGWRRSMVNNMWTGWGPRLGSVILVVLIAIMWLFWMTPWVVGSLGVVWGDASMLVVGSAQGVAGLAALRLARGRWRGVLCAGVVMPLSVVLLTTAVGRGLVQAWRRGGPVWKGREVPTGQRLPHWNPQAVRSRG